MVRIIVTRTATDYLKVPDGYDIALTTDWLSVRAKPVGALAVSRCRVDFVATKSRLISC